MILAWPHRAAQARVNPPEDFEPAPTPAPDWLPELAAVADPSALPPPPGDWLPDVERMEQAARRPESS